MNSKIVKRDVDFAKWYTSVIKNADLIDYGLIKGTIIFKPYAWSIWKNIEKYIDDEFKKMNVQNCCLPLMIPYSEFLKEKKHIQGFAPELFMVSELGDKKLEDKYVIRPTSEISFCHYFKNNVSSYKSLPIILNQWCNVFRVEKNTRPFLRTCEFFWQEQHAVFATKEEANEFAKQMIIIYQKFMEEILLIPVLCGKKTEYEKFAGAEITYTIEAILQDGQALQSGTSHYLGQNFSEKFNIKFQDDDNVFKYVYQTSAGVSTRLIGAIIMSHSDDDGLVLPTKIAPIQIMINTIFADKNDSVLIVANKIYSILKNTYRCELNSSNLSLGAKMEQSILKGIPLQIILGPKNINDKTIQICLRTNFNRKISISINDFSIEKMQSFLDEIDNCIYEKAVKNFEDKIVFVDNFIDFQDALNQRKVVVAYWDGTKEEEEKLKQLTQASSRCIREKTKKKGTCFFTNRKTNQLVYFARAY